MILFRFIYSAFVLIMTDTSSFNENQLPYKRSSKIFNMTSKSPSKSSDLRSPLRHTQEYNREMRRSSNRYRWSNSRKEALERKFKQQAADDQSERKKKDSLRKELKASSSNWFDQVEKSNELAEEANELRSMIESPTCRPRTRISSASEVEDDNVVLMRREKQIEYGKNTITYDNYLDAVPKNHRTRFHPHTPDKFIKCSRRSWDAQVRIWRRALHDWEGFAEEQRKKILAKQETAAVQNGELKSNEETNNDEPKSEEIEVPPIASYDDNDDDLSTLSHDDDFDLVAL